MQGIPSSQKDLFIGGYSTVTWKAAANGVSLDPSPIIVANEIGLKSVKAPEGREGICSIQFNSTCIECLLCARHQTINFEEC